MQTLDFVSGFESPILTTALVFISGYSNSEYVFYCSNNNIIVKEAGDVSPECRVVSVRKGLREGLLQE